MIILPQSATTSMYHCVPLGSHILKLEGGTVLTSWLHFSGPVGERHLRLTIIHKAFLGFKLWQGAVVFKSGRTPAWGRASLMS